MSRKKERRAQAKLPPPEQAPAARKRRRLAWMPLWGWVLLFLLPLIASEAMFYMVGRLGSMILFPLAWTGFWLAVMQRSGWEILKRGGKA